MNRRRVKLALGLTALAVVVLSVRQLLLSWAVVKAPPLIPSPPQQPQKRSPDFEIEGVVSEIRFPERDDVVDVMATSDVSKCYVAKLAPIKSVKGDFHEKSLSILIHSPSLELGIRSEGQTISLGLVRASGQISIVRPPGTFPIVPNLSRVRYSLFRLPE
jgi:hypothetical protein